MLERGKVDDRLEFICRECWIVHDVPIYMPEAWLKIRKRDQEVEPELHQLRAISTTTQIRLADR